MLVLLLIKHSYNYYYEFEFKLELNSNIIKIISFAEDKHMVLVLVSGFMLVSIEQFQIKLISLKLLIINEFIFVMIQHY